MSFGFSIGDIIAASRLAQEIYDNCFTRSQAAGELLRGCFLPLDSAPDHVTIPLLQWLTSTLFPALNRCQICSISPRDPVSRTQSEAIGKYSHQCWCSAVETTMAHRRRTLRRSIKGPAGGYRRFSEDAERLRATFARSCSARAWESKHCCQSGLVDFDRIGCQQSPRAS